VVAMRDAAAAIRREATTALGNFKPQTAGTVRALVLALKEEQDDQTRANAARALHGPSAKLATAALLQALKEDRSAPVREGAAYSLRGASADPTLLAGLRAVLADQQSGRVRVEAAMAVATLVPNDKDAVGVLGTTLEGNDS